MWHIQKDGFRGRKVCYLFSKKAYFAFTMRYKRRESEYEEEFRIAGKFMNNYFS